MNSIFDKISQAICEFLISLIEDMELKSITETVIDKLERMTNDEFSKLELVPDIDMED